jgi:hypothetical protein
MLALVVCNGWINEIIVAFLGPLPLSRRPESSAANDFGIVRVLELALRPLLIGRSLFTKRPESFNRRLWCRNAPFDTPTLAKLCGLHQFNVEIASRPAKALPNPDVILNCRRCNVRGCLATIDPWPHTVTLHPAGSCN